MSEEPDFNEISFEVKFRFEPIKAIDESEYIMNDILYMSLLLQARKAYIDAFTNWLKQEYPLSSELGDDDEELVQGYRNDIERSLSKRESLAEQISEEAIQLRIKECDALFKRQDPEINPGDLSDATEGLV